MKKTISLLAICLLLLCGTACHRLNDGNLSIAVTDSDDQYKIKADYDENKTWKLYKYINKSIKPNGLFESEDDYMDVDTELSDHTKLYIKASPGKLLITMDKRQNSRESYDRVRKMGEGVKKILAD